MGDRPLRTERNRSASRLSWDSQGVVGRTGRPGAPVGDRSPRSGDWQTQDLFAWGARQRKYRESGSISVRRSLSTATVSRHGRGGRRRDSRLGDYLYSSRSGRLQPDRRIAGVQRNRILFGLLVLSLVLYVVGHLVGV